ncbi:MAG: DUF6261 family protein [Dysgonamonadaceae bacterium]|jgi:hypothetical protein|nr:DUF6261 family protein [Dysgonamonadaceae bacterium]
MNKISSIWFRYLRGEAHYQFLLLFNETVNEHPAVRSIAGPLYDDFTVWLNRESKVVDMQKTSLYTERIVEVNLRADRLITGISKVVSAGMYHFNPAMVAAAKELRIRLKAFGRIQWKAYKEKSAAIGILIADFRLPDYAPPVDLLGLTPWIDELENTHNHFDHLLKQRNIEWTQKPQDRLIDIRRQIDSIYRRIVERINSAETFDTEGVYLPFIRQLNTLIASFNKHYRPPKTSDRPPSIVTSDG